MKKIALTLTFGLFLSFGMISSSIAVDTNMTETVYQGEKGGKKKNKEKCKHSKVECAKASATPSCQSKASTQKCSKPCPKTSGAKSCHGAKAKE